MKTHELAVGEHKGAVRAGARGGRSGASDAHADAASRHAEAEAFYASRPWLKHYPECVPHSLEGTYPIGPAWQLLGRTATDFPDRTACVYYAQRLKYGEVFEAARRVASLLREVGVQRGQTVGLMLPNTPEYLIALNGAWMAGAVPVALSPLLVAEEVTALLKATRTTTVISLDLLLPLVAGEGSPASTFLVTTIKDRLPKQWQRLGYAFARLRRLGWKVPPGIRRLQWHEALQSVAPAVDLFEPDDWSATPAYVLPTGGTTGRPKAVVLSHCNLVSNAWQLFHWAGRQVGTESMMAVLPFFHSYGLSSCLMTGVLLAAPLIMLHRFIPRVVRALLEEQRPTIFPAVPAMLSALIPLLEKRPLRHRSLKFCISGGAPLPLDVAERFAALTGAVVVEGYGLSECSPVTHTGPLDGTHRPGTIGLPLPDTEARIVDIATGQYSVPPGEVGELAVRGPQVFMGYWENPEATAEVLREGWLYTGDLATCDHDGFFRIVDRKKDLIITSGFNVYPTDVEHVLRQCPGVRDVAVVGVPDERRGEAVKAFVVCEPSACPSEAQFRSFAEQHLAKHKRPQIVEFVEQLPKNFLGKVLRRHLRDTDEAADAG